MSLDPDSGVRKQDGATVISSIAKNSVGRDLVWNWLRNSWKKISSYYDPQSSKTIGRIIKVVSSDFNTPLKLHELEEWYNKHEAELASAKRNALISIQNVKADVKWMDDHYGVIKEWLELRLKL